MRIIKTETYNVTSGQVLELNLCDNQTGSTTVGEIHFSTSTNLPYSIASSVDGKNFLAQSVINMGTYDTATSVASAGIYMIAATGLAKVRLTFTGAGTITIKQIY